jgi:sugar/nucleoside kinase (ribokinase family)
MCEPLVDPSSGDRQATSRESTVVSMPTSPRATVSPAASPLVACAGMVVVDHVTPPIARLPRVGELVAVDQLVLNIGGGAANTAVDLTRLGVGVSICARVGDDVFGRFATETLVSHGVDVKALRIDARRATSQTLILNVRGEDRRFIHSLGANLEFTSADIDQVLDPPARVLHIGYFLILPQLDPDGLAEHFARARKSGTKTVLDVATPGPGNYLEPLRTVLPHTDVFVPNTDEAALILGEDDPVRQARIFHDMGARRVVITRGEHGVISVSDEQRLKVGAYPVDFVDGSGGGDAFNAGYIVGLLEDRSELDCLRLASAVGASCVRAVGTTAGVFDRSETADFLRRHELAVETLA